MKKRMYQDNKARSLKNRSNCQHANWSLKADLQRFLGMVSTISRKSVFQKCKRFAAKDTLVFVELQTTSSNACQYTSVRRRSRSYLVVLHTTMSFCEYAHPGKSAEATSAWKISPAEWISNVRRLKVKHPNEVPQVTKYAFSSTTLICTKLGEVMSRDILEIISLVVYINCILMMIFKVFFTRFGFSCSNASFKAFSSVKSASRKSLSCRSWFETPQTIISWPVNLSEFQIRVCSLVSLPLWQIRWMTVA